MSYNTGEALIQARIETTDSFNSRNSRRGVWLILNRGISRHHAILAKGPDSPKEWIAFSTYLANYTTIIQVWVRYKDDDETKRKLWNLVDEIITDLDKYPHLNDQNGVISSAKVQTEPEPQEMWNKGAKGGPSWLRQDIIILWKEEIRVTFLD